MNIAVLGATSSIARDIIRLFLKEKKFRLFLFTRNINVLHNQGLVTNETSSEGFYYSKFNDFDYDLIINFIGPGNPKLSADLGRKVVEITEHYDILVLNYLRENTKATYINISSGAVYGDKVFNDRSAKGSLEFDIDNLQNTDFYGLSKLICEIRHRASQELRIIDIRIFSYVSDCVSKECSLFISELFRSTYMNEEFITNKTNFYRDYIDAPFLYESILGFSQQDKFNAAFNISSRKPTSKIEILEYFQKKFGLRLSWLDSSMNGYRALKPFYFPQERFEFDSISMSSLSSIEIISRAYIKFCSREQENLKNG